MSFPHLSVLVCSYNNSTHLKDCLKAIRQSKHNNYELIVVDDGSTDDTYEMAVQYADLAIKLPENRGRSVARNTARENATGGILVFIDSDVIIFPDTLIVIDAFFKFHSHITAFTCLLSLQHPNEDFWSQYKNLYMNYTFSRQPEYVSFLYGSFHALRAEAFLPYGDVVKIADDTALGQHLIANGLKIALLKNLQVIHLKKYSLYQLLCNDYFIPRDMAMIFIRFKGWKQLGKNKTGFIHSPVSQLLSVSLIPLFIVIAIQIRYGWASIWLLIGLSICWLLLNIRFFIFLSRKKNIFFSLLSILFTIVDQAVMATGIIIGFIQGIAMYWIKQRKADTSPGVLRI